ncbi:MarR family winged helix-turn-helix transcriptional regulator [Donghicola mangrovi]|uniref:MarR family transcriptional regulator n=1 Tax=Donghicola mangrovi TaxID=2729614 RepID=A0A850Q5U3_9RHOB|nr:MarR family transcriptional regulator [Donghicola mangrovi]NVO24323.1 MarR family transcriptional regulator [Donghicola mangrovi]
MKAHSMAGHLIRRLNQHSTQVFTRRMQEMGMDLTSVQFAALEAILTHPGIDQAGVAAHIAYDRATIGGVIDRLVQKGLVERQTSKRDRRAKEVRGTAQGQAAFDQVLPVVTDLQTEVLGGLDAAEVEIFLSLARKVINAAADQSELP